MLGAEIIAKTLKSLGVEKVFLFPGGTVAPLLDALTKEGIEYICARNEQGAGYAAIGAAKISGEPQVVLVTSGPGATNLVTPIADAYYDSVPIIAFTGQVATKDINFQKKVRQTGFQETDTVGIYSPITKSASILKNEDNIYNNIVDAYYECKNGRPGPVVIDLPMDVQRNQIAVSGGSEQTKLETIQHNYAEIDCGIDDKTVLRIKEKISNAKNPLILAGNGVHISNASRQLREFVDIYNIPLVCSLPGVGSLPSNHRLYYDFIGHTGEYYANLAAYHCDLLLVLGARLDLRQTGTEIDSFVKNKQIIRVDIDNNELNHIRINEGIKIHCDLKEFLIKMLEGSSNLSNLNLSDWIKRIDSWKGEYKSSQFYANLKLSSYHLIKSVSEYTKDVKVIVSSGVGIHQQLAARYFEFSQPDRIWLTSAGHGTMGYDVPTMIGAILKSTSHDYGIVFVGDGSFQMNIQELATIKNLELPIKIFVLDNNRLGIVSQFQLMNWDSDESTGGKINPSFSKIGIAYGLGGYDIYDKEEIIDILNKVFEDSSPVVVHCHIDVREDVLPMLLAGQKMNEMYPFQGEV